MAPPFVLGVYCHIVKDSNSSFGTPVVSQRKRHQRRIHLSSNNPALAPSKTRWRALE